MQDVGQVAPRLLLHQDGSHQKMQVLHAELGPAICNSASRKRDAELLLLKAEIKLRGKRLRRLLRDDLNAGCRWSGPHVKRTRHELDRIWQCGAKLLKAGVPS